jgi:hypothetical protein
VTANRREGRESARGKGGAAGGRSIRDSTIEGRCQGESEVNDLAIGGWAETAVRGDFTHLEDGLFDDGNALAGGHSSVVKDGSRREADDHDSRVLHSRRKVEEACE